MNITGFYYLHENGDLIYKPHADLYDMDSPFVKRYWPARAFGATPQVFLDNLKSAMKSGAKESEVRRLINFNNLEDYIPDCWEQVGISK